MKTQRIVIVILAVLVVWLAYLQLSGGTKPATDKPNEIWRTNTVELWRTNTTQMWRTNTVELWRTNMILQTVTNEVIKEVPARLSAPATQAATSGYKYLNAPLVTDSSDRLYKASPVAVEVLMGDGVQGMLGEDAAVSKASIEGALRSRSIPVEGKSPYQLSLNMASSWTTDVPNVRICTFSVELRENVVLQRQGDVVTSAGVVWRSTTSKLIRTGNAAADVNAAVDAQLEKFANDYRKAKERQKEVESKLPTIPADFLSDGK